jgi:hypothetical protein
MHFSFYGFAIAIVAMVVVSMLTKKTPDSILDATQTGLYISRK